MKQVVCVKRMLSGINLYNLVCGGLWWFVLLCVVVCVNGFVNSCGKHHISLVPNSIVHTFCISEFES